ncbi:unnamed protein product [Fraxinus pennsylvanica]|uniref:Uncharacterized protein n=1 Tax=Fraxinus pennsylvanica TaxID=56036 RepID=A0AAD2EFE2_9LAMI|nr:unnamed protein product [Fraxinus pennsylvanica]
MLALASCIDAVVASPPDYAVAWDGTVPTLESSSAFGVGQFEITGEDDGSELDDPYCAYSEEEFHTDHSSDEENNYRFPTYDADMEKQKGLQKVIEELYLDAEHRFCVRHMYTNIFRAEFKSLTLKGYLWKAAKSTTVPDWKFWVDELAKESAGAFE